MKENEELNQNLEYILVENKNITKKITKESNEELINRTGQAKKVANLVDCKVIEGSIETPFNYISAKIKYEEFIFNKVKVYAEEQKLDLLINHDEFVFLQKKGFDKYLKNAEVIVDETNFTILYQNNTHLDIAQTKVKGSLTINKNLKEFGINTDKRYGVAELRKLLRKNKRYINSNDFLDWELELANYSSQRHENIDIKDNLRGATQKNLQRETESNLPDTFKLMIPLFTDSSDTTIQVEVCIDDVNPNLFYLDSIDLYNYLEAEAKIRMDRVVNGFIELGIAIVYQ